MAVEPDRGEAGRGIAKPGAPPPQGEEAPPHVEPVCVSILTLRRRLFERREAGQGLPEFGLILGLVALVATTANQVSAQPPTTTARPFTLMSVTMLVVKMGTSLQWSIDLDPQGKLVPVPGVGTLVRCLEPARHLHGRPARHG